MEWIIKLIKEGNPHLSVAEYIRRSQSAELQNICVINKSYW